MPNWCNNTMKLSHPDPAMLEKAAAAWNSGEFLSVMVPEPDYPGYKDCEIKPGAMPDWWTWRVKNWGTKWDIGRDKSLDNHAEIVGGEMFVHFDSAWAPPIEAYDTMTEQGFSILAYYFEPGMGFCGRYEDGIDDYYEVGEGEIPTDIDEEMGIADTLSHYEV